MTGRCAYAYDCRKFLDGCDDSCPTPQEYPPLDPARIRGAWNARRSIYARLPRFVVVAPSQWIAREARAGLWKSHRIEVIPYGVPTEVYVPRLPEERRSIRRELGVADEDVFGVVIADNLGERRKGFDLAREALAGGHSGLAVGMIGASDAMPGIAGVKSFHLGYVGDERRMSSICAAADFLLHPAPVDNLPNVVLEAMACGTPTVAFPIGGLPDMVRPGRTGWLAAETSAAGLRRALATATAAVRGASSYRESCRAVAEEEYTEALQARRYAALFSEMLEAAAGDRARSL
jgi:glycosyltransferase involved in cell wall biosynthesis